MELDPVGEPHVDFARLVPSRARISLVLAEEDFAQLASRLIDALDQRVVILMVRVQNAGGPTAQQSQDHVPVAQVAGVLDPLEGARRWFIGAAFHVFTSRDCFPSPLAPQLNASHVKSLTFQRRPEGKLPYGVPIVTEPCSSCCLRGGPSGLLRCRPPDSIP